MIKLTGDAKIIVNGFDVAELIEVVKLLQEQVNDLRWRMNEICNFLSIGGEKMNDFTKEYNEQSDYRQPIIIDWSMNMANSIVAQILNNEHCKKDYARILAIATLKIADALRYEFNARINELGNE